MAPTRVDEEPAAAEDGAEEREAPLSSCGKAVFTRIRGLVVGEEEIARPSMDHGSRGGGGEEDDAIGGGRGRGIEGEVPRGGSSSRLARAGSFHGDAAAAEEREGLETFSRRSYLGGGNCNPHVILKSGSEEGIQGYKDEVEDEMAFPIGEKGKPARPPRLTEGVVARCFLVTEYPRGEALVVGAGSVGALVAPLVDGTGGIALAMEEAEEEEEWANGIAGEDTEALNREDRHIFVEQGSEVPYEYSAREGLKQEESC